MTEPGAMTKPVALVTGASIGIGEQFARLLAARENDLVLVARDAGRLDALAKELEATHGNHCEVLAADLTIPGERSAVERRVATVDVLVNNAGFGSFGNFHELDVDTEDRQIQLNVVALTRLTHAAARGMVARGRGAILNVASLAGFQPTPNDATYAATKAFVLSFSQAVHEELKGTGVAVSVLAPGFTRTEFQARADFDPKSVPGFLWQEAEPVARAGLDGLAKNRAVIVPGAMNKVAAGLSSVAPFGVTRRVARVAVKRA
jgi:short-subunit dehydrogenase